MKKTHKSLHPVQGLLFDQIEKQLLKSVIPAQEIADVLSLSIDAAYRRLRGETKLNIDEICILCEHFNISIDAMMDHKPTNVSFETLPISNLLSHLDTLGGVLKSFGLASDKKLLLLAAEIPLVHLAAYEELATFKIYAWASSVYNDADNYTSFCARAKGDQLFNCYREISHHYKLIPSLEIWNTNSYDSTLGWIDFFYGAGNLSKETALELCAHLMQLTADLQTSLEKGDRDNPAGNKLSFYSCDVALENNFMVVKGGDQQSCFLRLFSANGMIIRDLSYCRETEKWFYKHLDKSTLISGSSQKDRHRFFKSLRDKVEQTVDRLRP